MASRRVSSSDEEEEPCEDSPKERSCAVFVERILSYGIHREDLVARDSSGGSFPALSVLVHCASPVKVDDPRSVRRASGFAPRGEDTTSGPCPRGEEASETSLKSCTRGGIHERSHTGNSGGGNTASGADGAGVVQFHMRSRRGMTIIIV